MKHTCEIQISDSNRNIDYVLSVSFTWNKGDPGCWRTPNGDGWPAEPAFPEIDEVLCTEVIVWADKRGISAKPGLDPEPGQEKHWGDYCLSHHEKEIVERITDWYSQQEPDEPDWDAIRDAKIEREMERKRAI